MSTYSIKDLEKLTGVKAHTIRIWEQRYDLVQPKRTETNIRYYNERDLKYLMNIALLNEHGYKISKIASMSQAELKTKVLELVSKQFDFPDQIQNLNLAMIDMDRARFEKIFSNNVLHHGFQQTMMKIIFPFVEKMDILWQTGTIGTSQERFMYCMIRNKLIVAIDGQHQTPDESKPHFVMFLPEGERNELGLLYAYYYLINKKVPVTYLGHSIHPDDLGDIYDNKRPDYICSIITTRIQKANLNGELSMMLGKYPQSNIVLTGYRMHSDEEANTHVENIDKMEDFLEFVDKL